MATSFILWWRIAVLAWLLLKSRMVHRKTLNTILEIVVAWSVLFTAPFFIPQIPWPCNLRIGILTTAGLAIFTVVYFYLATEADEADRKLAQDDLRVHYQNLILRMGQWRYVYREFSDEMICLPLHDKNDIQRLLTPPTLEKDKMHLKEFKKTYSLYLEGKNLSIEYKAKKTEAERLLLASVRKSLEEKGMTIDEMEQRSLVFWLHMMIEGELTVIPFEGELKTIRYVPVPDDTPPALLGIRDELKQRQDLRKSIYDELLVRGGIRSNEREFLKSLGREVIERSKESNYSIEELSKGVCDDCKHLKAILA